MLRRSVGMLRYGAPRHTHAEVADQLVNSQAMVKTHLGSVLTELELRDDLDSARGAQNRGIASATGLSGSWAGSPAGSVPANHGSSFQSGTGGCREAEGTNGEWSTNS